MAAKDTIEPGWYSIEGAAIYTGFSVTAIRTAMRLKRFPFHRVLVSGGSNDPVRIKREHLDAWIEGRPADAPELARVALEWLDRASELSDLAGDAKGIEISATLEHHREELAAVYRKCAERLLMELGPGPDKAHRAESAP